MARTCRRSVEFPIASSAGRGSGSRPSASAGWHLALPNVDEQLALRIVAAGDRRGHQLPRQLLGLQRGRERGADGEGAPGRLPGEGVPDDQDRRALEARRPPRQLDESLRRLRTDRIDLVQHHEVIRFEDPHRIFERGRRQRGAASRRGRRASSATSASPDTRIRTSTCTCWRSPASTASPSTPSQMPLNVMDAHYRSFEKLRAAGAGAGSASACWG